MFRFVKVTAITPRRGRLADAGLDAVRDDLAGVVHQTLEPAHVSLWLSDHG